jgi:hypothetical protein
VRKPFLVCWKRHPPPWFTKFEFEKLLPFFYIISTQRSYIHQKLDTNSCFANLRAISNLCSFFLYTLYTFFRSNLARGKAKLFICYTIGIVDFEISVLSRDPLLILYVSLCSQLYAGRLMSLTFVS